MDALEFRFAFYARNFDLSFYFYHHTLGMARLGGWDRKDGKGALLSAGGNAVIEIYGAPEGQEYNGPIPGAINLAIRLADQAEVDQAYADFQAANCLLDGPPENRSWGHRSFVIHDPDGIPIHYYCELEP